MTETLTPALTDISGDYTIDPSHSRLGFVARHAMVTKVRGSFDEWQGTAHIDTANPAASWVKLTINAASVATGSADRDGHLKSADFFDVENFPEWTFASTAVSRDGDEWTITGDLTIKDVTHAVTIEFEEGGSAQRPVRQPPDRLRGRGHRQPQGLGPGLERRARDRRHPRLREDQARVRHLGDPRLMSDLINRSRPTPGWTTIPRVSAISLPSNLTTRPLAPDRLRRGARVDGRPGAARHRRGRDRGRGPDRRVAAPVVRPRGQLRRGPRQRSR